MNTEFLNPRDIKSKTLPELREELGELGLPKYRAEQVYRWLHRGVTDFSQMSDLSKALREELSQKYDIYYAQVERKQVSKDGTVKYLFRLPDGEYVESVLMHYHHGSSICISTQVGCKMNCSFCATGKVAFPGICRLEILPGAGRVPGRRGAHFPHRIDGYGRAFG